MYPLISIVADTEAKMAGSYRAAYDLVSDAPALVSFAKANLELICDVVKLGSGEDEDILFRLNVQKLIAFLRVKFRHLLECPVLHKWYQQDSPAGTVFTDEQRSLQVLHLLQQYVPLWVFNKFCASLGRRTTEVDEHVAASSQQLQKSLVARDVDLKRKREEVDEARKKLALSTASNSVKKMAREGKPKNVQSIMSFFGKKA
ncbi:hypothetical protein DIPPA_02013 [Diplonema papillatum]|nr:hypothetical protein DIPPA_02013 [Diplonema papillatum]